MKKVFVLLLLVNITIFSEEISSSGKVYVDNVYKYNFNMVTHSLNDTMFVQRIYFDVNGDTLLVEDIKIDKNRLIPYYFQSREIRFGRLESIKRITNSQFFMSFRKNKNADIEVDTIKDDGKYVIFSFLIPELIKLKFEQLLNGEMIKFRLLVPSRMETVGFRVKYLQKENGLTVIKMEASSWIIRKLVNPLFFYFDSNKKLVKYKGRISIPNDNNKPQDGITIYN